MSSQPAIRRSHPCRLVLVQYNNQVEAWGRGGQKEEPGFLLLGQLTTVEPLNHKKDVRGKESEHTFCSLPTNPNSAFGLLVGFRPSSSATYLGSLEPETLSISLTTDFARLVAAVRSVAVHLCPRVYIRDRRTVCVEAQTEVGMSAFRGPSTQPPLAPQGRTGPSSRPQLLQLPAPQNHYLTTTTPEETRLHYLTTYPSASSL
jgi:hypothetical protein